MGNGENLTPPKFGNAQEMIQNMNYCSRIGCFAFAILAGLLTSCGSSGLNSLLDAFPSEAELTAYEAAIEAFYEQIDSLPEVQWRIINETEGIVQVEFSSGLEEPSFPGDDAYFDPSFIGGESLLTEIAQRTLSIAPRGSVVGNLKCGELFLVSANAPSISIGVNVASSVRGLYVYPGNILLSGLGSPMADAQGFSGELVFGGRVLNPEADGINCGASTIRLTVNSLPTAPVVDPASGELLREATLGTGALSLE
jgi:hypothetical protein